VKHNNNSNDNMTKANAYGGVVMAHPLQECTEWRAVPSSCCPSDQADQHSL